MKPQLVAVAVGLILMSVGDAVARTGGGAERSMTVHEPGPIVNGHHRQPTPGEVRAR
jgi:hypothetical protein